MTLPSPNQIIDEGFSFDPTTGTWCLDKAHCFGPETKEASIVTGDKVVVNGNYAHYQVRTKHLVALLYFHNGHLTSISASVADPEVKSWENWSKQHATRQKQLHDALAAYTKTDAYRLESVQDIKTSGQLLMVNYNHQEAI